MDTARRSTLSSAFEGFLILMAALGIAYAAVDRLLAPQPLEDVGVGLAVSVAASIVNLLTARTLMGVGRKHNSIALEADAHHLLTDVWTSAGVIAGVAPGLAHRLAVAGSGRLPCWWR
jgi:cation diffusion facilitator family transporter